MTTVAFANCKGGTGKSLVCASTAQILGSLGKDVIVLDADPYNPATALAMGLEGAGGTLLACGEKVKVWTSPSATESPSWPAPPAGGLRLIDTAPGLCPETRQAFAACDGLVLVALPEPVALLGALRSAREAMAVKPGLPIGLVVNRCQGERLGAHIASRFDAALGRFLSTGLDWSLTIGDFPQLRRKMSTRRLSSADGVPKSMKHLAEKVADWAPHGLDRTFVQILKHGPEIRQAA